VGGGTPLFVVAGMFGNVLNLSHLAHLLGEDRPFYALQARGLYGDSPPHETFEEMAVDYIAELRKVQPHGPYLLGGFSGGGLTAFEMARQLLAAGEEVAMLVLLDTPLPKKQKFTLPEQLSLYWQRARQGGMKKLWGRVAKLQQKIFGSPAPTAAADIGAAQFHSQRIGAAFLRAADRYRMQSTPVAVSLYRPKLPVRYRLSGGRMLNVDCEYLWPDNGWTPFVSSIKVNEVPGDHDSMVLEPNVRVLVTLLKKAVAAAEEKLQTRAPTTVAAHAGTDAAQAAAPAEAPQTTARPERSRAGSAR
jgi:thioesterase domain-containing protein